MRRRRRGRAGERHRRRAAVGRPRRDRLADHLGGRQRRQVRAGPLPGRARTTSGRATARCWSIRPRRSRSATRIWTPRSSCSLVAQGRARPRARRHARRARRSSPRRAPCCSAARRWRCRARRSARSIATASSWSATLLPGRYEISMRVGSRILQITSGPREVEIPIEPGATVDLPEHDHRPPAGRGMRPDRPLRGRARERLVQDAHAARGSRPARDGSRSRTR